MRLTKIICTIGPACDDAQNLRSLAKSGMDIARLNLSHGTDEDRQRILTDIREINDSGAHCIATMVDTRGAEIRTGVVQYPIEIEENQEVIFSSHVLSDEKRPVISVNYNRFYNDVCETDRILVDNGEMSFEILDVRDDGAVIAKALNAGLIGDRRHINLPGADIDLPSITDDDWDDIAFAVKEDIDFVALSFIRSAEEVSGVRKFLEEKKSTAQIITKLETHKAIENIDEILDVTDAIMVARGDLGADLPFEELPILQDGIVSRCRDRGIPVIVATHMLESMIDHPMPTRAEVTDVAHAAMTGTDATMLSGETAVGKYPVKAVEAMSRILQTTEKHMARLDGIGSVALHNTGDDNALKAIEYAAKKNAQAIVVTSTKDACDVSSCHPSIPVISLTSTASEQRSLQLLYGIFSFVCDDIEQGIKFAKEAGTLSDGDTVVIYADHSSTIKQV